MLELLKKGCNALKERLRCTYTIIPVIILDTVLQSTPVSQNKKLRLLNMSINIFGPTTNLQYSGTISSLPVLQVVVKTDYNTSLPQVVPLTPSL